MLEIIKTGIILMIYSLIAGASLAYVYIQTAPIIEANRLAASGDEVRAQVLPEMTGGYELQDEENDFSYWIGYSDAGKTQPGGYIFIASRKGYSSTIESMIGADTDGTITGVKILFQQETPGLGDKIEEIRSGEIEPWFQQQFIGKSFDDNIKVKKDGGSIDAISGATVSSRTVTESINNGLKRLMEIVGGESFAQKAELPEINSIETQTEEEINEAASTIPSDETLTAVLPDMAGGYELQDGESEFPYWTGYLDTGKTKPGGYLFISRGEGFASTIETLVGVSIDGRIVGIKILSHEETPGYGDRLDEINEGESEPWFTRQFIDKSVSDTIALKEDSGDIDAITEATISSRAVTESIDNGTKKLLEIVKDFTQ